MTSDTSVESHAGFGREVDAAAFIETFAGPAQPGLSVAVSANGRSIFRCALGLADLDHGVPITPDTPFHAASVTKQFTAFSIALLEREGYLAIEDDIRKYLPYVPQFESPITIAHLLHHTSGLRDQWSLFQLGGLEMRSHLRQEQAVNVVKRQRDLNFPTGSDFSYCNTGYTLLAEIVRVVSGRTLRQFTHEHIFRPLGMNSTFIYDNSTEIVPGRAHSYARQPDGRWGLVRLNYQIWGTTSLHTTASDLVLWGANFIRPKVGDRELIRRITTPGLLNDGTRLRYGYGLIMDERIGHRAIFHGGADAGFRSHFVHFPDDDVTVAVLANSPLDVQHIAERLADILLHDGSHRLGELIRGSPAVPERSPSALIGCFATEKGETLEVISGTDGVAVRLPGFGTQKIVFRADGSFDIGQPEMVAWRARIGGDGLVQEIVPSSSFGASPRVYRRVALVVPTVAELQSLIGDYVSRELDITYSLAVEDGRLTARTLWTPEPIVFEPTVADKFRSDTTFISALVIDRSPDGRPVGFTINSGRIMGVKFRRSGAPDVHR